MTQYDSVLLAEMTWPEVQEALDSGVTTAIVAVGSIEQHGPHLPLRMDTMAGDELSRRIAERLGNAVAAPTNTVAPDIAREIEANVIALADLDEYMGLLNEGLQAADIDYDEPVSHAGATETSLVLAAEEELVRTEEYEPGHEGPVSTARLLSDGFAAVTENGVLGNPTYAAAQAGEEAFELVAEEYTEQIDAERDAV
ncbi:MAG: creatininase [Halobacteriales archaeon SW_8_66_22]|nr:MAG: creatininase [Halobacteriales archaeon SW_8_66_22]